MDILVIYKVKWSHKWKKSWQGPKRLQGSLYWSLFYSYVYMYTCSYVYVCVFTYLIVHARSQSCKTLSNLRIFVHLFFFFKTGLSLALVLRIWSGWPATEPQKSAFSASPVLGWQVCGATTPGVFTVALCWITTSDWILSILPAKASPQPLMNTFLRGRE